MKRFLFSIAASALLLLTNQAVRADVSLNFFYDNLNGGSWYQVGDYGYVWQPEVASNDPNWRPYTDGYWAYTDQGWTWVSYEDFGWATYHYGRWARLADYGWVWVPGYEWGPAWVSWRTGGDYVGWAPLPPAEHEEVVYEGRPVTGPVDVEYGIGPAYYNFIDLRYIGEPVLRTYIFPYNQNIGYIGRTVNVTNIVYSNGMAYNYGPDYGTLSMYSTRPIQYLTIQRQSIDPLQAIRSGNITKVQGNRLVLAAPMRLERAPAQIAPKQVKAKIDQPKFEKGWSGVSDPNAKAQLEQKFKSENRNQIQKPTFQPTNAKAAAGVNATNVAAPGASAAPEVGRGKGKNKGQAFEAQPGASPAVGAAGLGQGKKNKGQKFQAETGAPVAPGNAGEGKGKNKGKNERAETMANPPGNAGTPDQNAGLTGSQNPGKGKNKGRNERAETMANPAANPATPDQNAALTGPENTGKGKHKGSRAEQNLGAVNEGPGGNGGKHHQKTNEAAMQAPNAGATMQSGEGRHKGQARLEQPPAPGSAVGQNLGGGKGHGGRPVTQGEQQAPQGKEKGKGKKGEPTPPPQ